MTDFKIIRCLADLLQGNSIHNYTIKEQKITQEMCKHVKKIDVATFNNMVKRISSCDINDVLYYTFEDGRINHGRIFSVYAFTAYCMIHHTDDAEVALRIFDNFYLDFLTQWIEKHDVWDQLYTSSQRRERTINTLDCVIL